MEERAWKAICDRLQRPCHLSRVDHDKIIRCRKQKTNIEKHSFVNRTIQLRNQLPADALELSPVNQVILGKFLFIYLFILLSII
jgi:hypothetical protein